MQPRPSHPTQIQGRRKQGHSRRTPGDSADGPRDEVRRQLDLASREAAGIPAAGDEAAGSRPIEFIEFAQHEALQFQESIRRERALARGRAALEATDRIANGTYAICARYAQRIPPKRLQAVPLTAYCVACQRALEGIRKKAA